MELSEITLLIGAAGGLTGITELVRSWTRRKTASRMAEANASTTETTARGAEFDLLARHNEFLQKALSEESARFSDQTRRLRETQDELAECRKRESQKDISLTHLRMWRCESGDCPQRRPPQPLLYGRKFDESSILNEQCHEKD